MFTDQNNTTQNCVSVYDWSRGRNASNMPGIHNSFNYHHQAYPNFTGTPNYGYNYPPMPPMNAYGSYYGNQAMMYPNYMQQQDMYAPFMSPTMQESPYMTAQGQDTSFLNSAAPDTPFVTSAAQETPSLIFTDPAKSLATTVCPNDCNSTTTMNTSPMLLTDFIQTPEVSQEVTIPMDIADVPIKPICSEDVQMKSITNATPMETDDNYQSILDQLQNKRDEASKTDMMEELTASADACIEEAIKRMKSTLTCREDKENKKKKSDKEKKTEKSKKKPKKENVEKKPTKTKKESSKTSRSSETKRNEKGKKVASNPSKLPLTTDFLDHMNRLYNENRNLFDTFANTKLIDLMGNTITTESLLAPNTNSTADEGPVFLETKGMKPSDVEALRELYRDNRRTPDEDNAENDHDNSKKSKPRPKKQQGDESSTGTKSNKKKMMNVDAELQKHTNGVLEACEDTDTFHFKVTQRPEDWLKERKEASSRAIVSPMSSGKIVKIGTKSAEVFQRCF